MKAHKLTVLLLISILLSGLGALTAAAASLPGQPLQEPAYSVYLPSVGSSFLVTPEPTPTPDAVFITSHRGYRDDWMYQVYVEIVNGRAGEVCDVSVAGKFYNSNGALIAQASGDSMLDKLERSQKAPVHITVYTSAGDIASYGIEAPRDYSCYGSTESLTVLSQNVRNSGGVEVYGEVRNDTDQPRSSIGAIATFYDSQGSIWYAEEGRLQGGVTLAPGEKGVYNILTFDKDLFGMPFTVQAQSDISPWEQ